MLMAFLCTWFLRSPFHDVLDNKCVFTSIQNFRMTCSGFRPLRAGQVKCAAGACVLVKNGGFRKSMGDTVKMGREKIRRAEIHRLTVDVVGVVVVT